MTSAVCTLFEGDYHLGLAAFANSLHFNGFRGTIFAGYRGPLPPWAESRTQKPEVGNRKSEVGGHVEFSPADGLILRFIPLTTKLHLTNYKPDFMLSLWESHCPSAEALFYFDPDITIKCRWTFFEEWIGAGVAVCQDINGSMPDNHPIRHAWMKKLQPYGLEFPNHFNIYFNAGFVGLSVHDRSFLTDWQKVQSLMLECGADFNSLGVGDRTYLFTCRDQDALNIACMVTEKHVSPVGQDGMDFQWGGGGWIMSHAAGGQKPWRKAMLLSLLIRGVGPTRADKSFYQFRSNPICPYSKIILLVTTIDLKIASALARFIG